MKYQLDYNTYSQFEWEFDKEVELSGESHCDGDPHEDTQDQGWEYYSESFVHENTPWLTLVKPDSPQDSKFPHILFNVGCCWYKQQEEGQGEGDYSHNCDEELHKAEIRLETVPDVLAVQQHCQVISEVSSQSIGDESSLIVCQIRSQIYKDRLLGKPVHVIIVFDQCLVGIYHPTRLIEQSVK